MKQGKITTAYKAITVLYKVKGLPFSLSSRLFSLKRKLEPFVTHQAEQETAILEEFNAINPDGTLNIKTENVNQINARLAEIQEAEVEWNDEPVTILLDDDLCEKMEITGEVIDKTDGFIRFETEGE